MERKFSQDAAYTNRLKVTQNYISPQLQQTSALFPRKNLKTREPPYSRSKI